MKKSNNGKYVEGEMTELNVADIERNNEPKFFPIIAMGGSAGSFSSFEQFFLHVPARCGYAFVVIMHMDPSQNMDVAGLLQQSCSMPVVEAQDGVKLSPDHVYIIPPDADMGIHNGQLLLFKASRPKGAHMSIDYFMQSLAEDQWNYAVGIIFSGMGADGETGIRMIKEKLGMTMVQLPETAEYPSMPAAALATGMADYILPVEEMPGKLIQYLSHPVLTVIGADELINERNNLTHLNKILLLLRSHTGHDFTLYKKNTITRRVERRIAYHQLPDYIHYVNFLRENTQEIEVLFKELLIGVTKFFRDEPAFDVVKDQLYAKLSVKGKSDPIRIWIAGCSTGEEAYSIAILVSEFLSTVKTSPLPKVQIFATDLDPNAIEHARSGFYFSNIVSEISEERLERFFSQKNNGYVVKKEVREMIVFAQHNLIKDAPFTRLDLLCCRNVMIYLTADLQKKLMPIFHYSLNIGGMLFLGPAESVGIYNDAFLVLDSKWKLYERKNGAPATAKLIDFPFNITNQIDKNNKGIEHKPVSKSLLAERFHKVLLENYSPASLLVDEKGEISYINGTVEKYLKFSSGEASMNIHKVVIEELRYVLGNALHQCALKKNIVTYTGLKIMHNGIVHLIDFTVDYLNDMQLHNLYILVFFDRGPVKKRKSIIGITNLKHGTVVNELEKELVYTKQQLHTTIEQMETSLEELKSTNEELQSTNEELQSTNEEALTTKEEMQSLNEELMTINLQYQNKAEELTRMNNDMKNLLDNTDIGTIFLDNSLNILRFTPQVNKLFNVIGSDIGRSITHIASNFDYPAIENTILEVIERLNGKELEVKTRNNEWYNLKIMPYRTMDNFISGAVLTFTKITPVKALESKFSSLLGYIQYAVDDLKDAAVILDHEGKIIVVNRLFLVMFRLREDEIKEQFFMEIVHTQWNTNKLNDLFHKDRSPAEIYFQHNFQGVGLKKLLIAVNYIPRDISAEHYVSVITFIEKECEQEK